MATIITDELKSDISCCVADLDYNTALKIKRGQVTDACILTAIIKTAQVKIMNEYIPNGTLLVAGYISDATVDLSLATVGISISGDIIVGPIDGSVDTYLVIGIIPEATYATVQDLVTAIIVAITALTGTTGYTAVDNGDLTITITAPAGSGSALNGTQVSIVLNPLFAVETLIDQRVPYIPRNVTYVDDPTDPLYGYYFVTCTGTTAADYKILVILDGVLQTTLTTGYTGAPFAITYNYNTDNLQVGSVNFPWRIYVRDNDYPNFTAISQPSGFLVFAHATFNDFNDCTYFTSGSVNLYKLDSSGNLSTIAMGVGTSYVSANPVNGDVWVTSGANIYRINAADAIVTTINVPGATWGIPYYDATTAKFYIPMHLGGVGTIEIYNTNGTLDTAAWFTTTGQPYDLFFSTTFNYWFIATSSVTQIVRTDASLKQNLAYASSQLEEDTKNRKIYATQTGVAQAEAIAHIFYTNTGEEVFTETLTNGTPDVYQEDADQCVPETDMNTMVQDLNSDCQNCPGSTTSVTPTPAGTQYTIYYGTDSTTPLVEADVLALGSVTAATYAGTFVYGASPGEYKYFAYPTVLGTPSRFYDSATNFDVVMDSPYTITVNSTLYTIYRSFNMLGGALTMVVQS